MHVVFTVNEPTVHDMSIKILAKQHCNRSVKKCVYVRQTSVMMEE